MNHRCFLLLALLPLVLPTSASAVVPATGPAVPGFEPYDREIPALLDRWSIPGVTIAVAQDGRIVFARGYGFADRDTGRPMQPDTRGRIGSVSKTITATAILRLVETGRLSLDERVFPLLGWPVPDYPQAARDPRLDQITVRQLLSHTAGWRSHIAPVPFSDGRIGFDPLYAQREIAAFFGVPPPASSELICRAMVGLPLQAAPGTVYDYSNVGYAMLGRIIEHVTGQRYEDAVRQLLAGAELSGLRIGATVRSELGSDEPVYYDYPGAALEQNHLAVSGVVPEPYAYSLNSWDADGGWTISAIEGVRFLLALDGTGRTPPLLSSASLAAMRTEQFPGSAYGFGWVVNNAPLSSDSGHIGGLAGTIAFAVRSQDGRRLSFVIFNSRPADVDGFLADFFPVLHSIDGARRAGTHDFTDTTLGWAVWQHRWFPNGGDASALDDPDHDGLANLVEYSAGLDPSRADPAAPVLLTRQADGRLLVTYRRLILENALSWELECSPDGVRWETAAPLAPVTTRLNDDGTLSVSVLLDASGRVRLRLRQLSSGATAYVEPPLPATATDPRLVNISARVFGGSGNRVAIGGFVVKGSVLKRVLIRAVGPTLASQGIGDAELMSDPCIEVHDARRGGVLVATNDDWGSGADAAQIPVTARTLGAAPLTSADTTSSAVLLDLPPGPYTFLVRGRGDANGVVLAEVYDADPTNAAASFVNISTRAYCRTGNSVAIGGFVVSGQAPRRLLVRAVGPTLASQGLDATEVLTDPAVEVHDARHGNVVIAQNDDWSTSSDATAIATTAARVGAAPLAATDTTSSALLLTVPPGVYSFVVQGKAGTSGIVLIEVYDAD